MGTAVSIRATSSRSARDLAVAIDEAVAWLHEVDRRFTTWRPESEWLSYAAGRIGLDDAHPDIRHVATTCEWLAEVSDGSFSLTADPDRPPDPAAYVKGWALQRAADLIVMAGADSVIVNGGGDIVVAGGEQPWRIGIQHPTRSDHVAAVVELQRGAVATSGAYERGAHIRHPATGTAATTWASVTVVGPDLGLADAYATAAFAMDRRAPAWLGERGDGYRAYFIDASGATCASGFAA
jgi:thiamine biosynthesis lipoprotein